MDGLQLARPDSPKFGRNVQSPAPAAGATSARQESVAFLPWHELLTTVNNLT